MTPTAETKERPTAAATNTRPAEIVREYGPFPGADQVDLVGASGYNFGQVGRLAWTDPEALFEDVYRQVSALSPKPFWVAETGSTNTGGSKAVWIAQLAALRTAIPSLGGIVWYDARDPNGDFRVGKSARKAFKGLVKRTSK